MPTPREIAEKVNDRSQFADGEAGYEATEGVPSTVSGTPRHDRDYRTNPTNPPEKPAPCTGLHK